MYTDINFKTKKALKEAIAAGREIGIFQAGPFGGNEIENGITSVEGPHYPRPHTLYARVELKNGIITKVLK